MKRCKRTLSILLICCMLTSLLPITALAADVVASGTCGDNLTWTLDSAGTLTISGTGDMADYSSSDRPWDENLSDIQTIVLDSGVTYIGDYAFYYCQNLSSVTIPDGITMIGYCAFGSCPSLTEITIPDSVTSIGNSAFRDCSSLSSITIPATAEISIDAPSASSVFEYCYNISYVKLTGSGEMVKYHPQETPWYWGNEGDHSVRIDIEYGVTSISDNAFDYCDNLSSISIPNSVTSIGDSAFRQCYGLTQVIIPNSVTSIGGSAFYSCSNLANVVLSNQLESIGTMAFSQCEKLTEIIIPESVDSIGESAFTGCSNLTEVTIPNGVLTIGKSAFWDCNSLKEISIPDTVTSIGVQAFSDCSSATELYIGTGLIDVGEYAFSGCDSLETIVYNAENASGISGDAFALNSANDGVDVVFGATVEIIPDNLFYRGSSYDDGIVVNSVVIGENVTEIGANAFYGANLVEINIPEKVLSIGESAFYRCAQLTDVAIGKNVKIIGADAFSSCSNLKNIYYSAISAQDVDLYNNGWGQSGVFRDSGTNSGVSIFIGNTTRVIPANIFADLNIVSLNLGNSVEDIGNYAFLCTTLSDLTIPNSVINIGQYSFARCSQLDQISMGKNVTFIDENAFLYSNITDVYYGSDENAWALIEGTGKPSGDTVTIHYNSTGPDDSDSDGTNGSVRYIHTWNEESQELFLDESLPLSGFGYSVTDQTDLSAVGDISQIVGKYMLVETDSTEVTSIKPVESAVGTVLSIGENLISFEEGKFLPVSSDLILTPYEGKTVVYHTYSSEIISIEILEEKTGKFEGYDRATGQVTIDGVTYNTNYLTDLSFLASADQTTNIKYFTKTVAAINEIVLVINRMADVESITKKLLSYDTVTNTVYFTDNTNYIVADGVSLDIHEFLGLWVTCTIRNDPEDGIRLTSMKKVASTTSERYRQFNSYDAGTNTVHFVDGSSLAVDAGASLSFDGLSANNWVKCTVSSNLNTGDSLTAIEKITATFDVEVAMVNDSEILYKDNKLGYDENSYADFANFDIEFNVTVTNTTTIPGHSAAQLQQDDSLAVTVSDFEISAPNGFNSGWDWGGDNALDVDPTILPGESWTGKGYIRAGLGYKPAAETNEYNVLVYADSSIGKESGLDTFKVKYVDWGESGGGGGQISGDLNGDWIQNFLQTLYDLDDINATCKSSSLNAYFDKQTREDIAHAVNLWQVAKSTDMVQNAAGLTMPQYLKIQCKMGDQITDKARRGHQATLYFWSKNPEFLGGSAAFNSVYFILIDEDTQSCLLEDALYEFNVTLQADKFANDMQTYLAEEYGDTWEDFFKELSKDAVGEIVEGWGIFAPSKQVALNSLMSILKEIDSVVEVSKDFVDFADLGYNTVLKTELEATSVFDGEVEKHLKKVKIECPVDVYVYNPQGELCGAIENNVIVTDTLETFMNVTGDQKTVWLNSSDYTVTLVARDKGVMDYTVEEYVLGEDTRTVSFDDVPLSVGITYEGSIPEEMDVPATDYALRSNTGEVIYADSDTNVTTPPPTDESGSNVGSGDDNSSPSYNITVPNVDHGAIKVNPTRAERGDTVTITATPDKGYELDTLTVTDKNGKEINLTDKGDDKYTFTMPSGKVTIDASFRLISEPEPWINPFTDVAEDVYYFNAVLWAFESGITAGTGDGTTFSPDAACTRAQMATFLWRAAGSPEPVGSVNPFADVPADAYYAKAVQWAVEKGITNGTGDGTTFSPNEPCTRGQMATFLWRNAGSPEPVGGASPFTDIPADIYYTKAVQWAYEQKITGGTTTTTFSPNDPCTRAQMVTFLYRNFAK